MDPPQQEAEEVQPRIEEPLENILDELLHRPPSSLRVQDVERFGSLKRIEAAPDVLDTMSESNIAGYASRYDVLKSITEALKGINNGSLFCPLDDLWDTELKSFDGADITEFHRTHHVTKTGKPNDTGQYYKNTAERALASDCVATINSSRATAASGKSANIDIFGVMTDSAELAHLMPHSPTCASCWYYLVPWVLNISAKSKDGFVDALEKSEIWNYLQKCIHGISSKKSKGSSQRRETRSSKKTKCEDGIKHESQEIVPQQSSRFDSKQSSQTEDKQNSQTEGKSISQTEDNQSSQAEGKSTSKPEGKSIIQADVTQSRRETNTGIKHFRSNRIYLQDQKVYLDQRHCLLIIPILDLQKVKEWRGEAYSAIVLATKYAINQHHWFPAAAIYKGIGAMEGILYFASEAECETSRCLLESSIHCVCKSFIETYRPDADSNAPQWKQVTDTLGKDWDSFQSDVKNIQKGKVSPDPKQESWPNPEKYVRKVKFNECGSDENPAPDPALLLGKSTSNWLKLQKWPILPGCDNSSSDGCSCSLSFSVDVADHLEWYSNTLKRPFIDEIAFDPCETLEESLSDDEDST